MMSAMDDAIGRVLDKVHEKDLDDNTLVFFISDNGGPTMKGTTINASRNDPLRGSKRTTLEGGIRVPFFVKWPGHVPAGKVYDKPVIQLDILPTALAAAGVEAPPTRSSMASICPVSQRQRKAAAARHAVLAIRRQMAIRQGDWKLVRYDPVVDGDEGHGNRCQAVQPARRHRRKQDLIKSEPEKAKELQAAWDEWNEFNVPPLWGNDGNVEERQRPRRAKSRRQPRMNAEQITRRALHMNYRTSAPRRLVACSRIRTMPRSSVPGTLIRLADAGWEIHIATVANGDCGSATLPNAKSRPFDAKKASPRRARSARRITASMSRTSIAFRQADDSAR